MKEIIKLSQEVIGQIAAGEVVERPAAAIKELVENSIDAGAKNITVEIREGGISYFRVSDNGHGIAPEQIRLAFERHATSKISSSADLYNIHTLGFRGEALASIAAVAKVTCTTRTAEQDYGICATVEAGRFLEIKQSASTIGTSIVVEKLFQNTPVRLKFLKKPSSEASAVANYMMRLILSRPDIAFRFMNDGKTIYRSSGDGKLSNAVFCIYGSEALKAMQPVHGHMNGLLLDGYVGVDILSKSNRNHQSFFINNRYFQSIDLSHALEEACKSRVMIGKFPMCVLQLSLPNPAVDVNVHPNKLEVRFQNEKEICEAITAIVGDSFAERTLKNAMSAKETPYQESTEPISAASAMHIEGAADIPTETSLQPKPPAAIVDTAKATDEVYQINRPTATGEAHPSKPAVVYYQKQIEVPKASAEPAVLNEPIAVYQVNRSAAPPQTQDLPEPEPSPAPDVMPSEPQLSVLPNDQTPNTALEKPTYIGSLFKTYLVFEQNGRVLLVDQHAAHEKILFDSYMKQYQTDSCSQMLLCPKLVRLSALEILQQNEWIPPLRDAGFVIEPFDEHCVSVYGIPIILNMLQTPDVLLHDAIEEWRLGKRGSGSDSLRIRIAQMACKHAIKGGDTLNQTQLQVLIEQILQSETEPYCPHGRPIVVEITQRELEKRFKRIQ